MAVISRIYSERAYRVKPQRRSVVKLLQLQLGFQSSKATCCPVFPKALQMLNDQKAFYFRVMQRTQITLL